MQACVLFIYANPSSSSRLRLELEDRRISEIVAHLRLPEGTKRSVQAASWNDLVEHVSSNDDMEILHFSGHGSPNAILLETSDSKGERIVSVQDLDYLLELAGFRFRGIVCMSCYSADALRPLVRRVPYIISVEGPVNDAAAIAFVDRFYWNFFRSNSIERSFYISSESVRLEYGEKLIRPILLKGSEAAGAERIVIKTAYRDFSVRGIPADELSIDVTEAMGRLSGNAQEREAVISLLQRKMRYHGWIFRYPRYRALVPLGPYVGLFSWESLSVPVICHSILKVLVSAEICIVDCWIDMIIDYNGFTVSNRYRSISSLGSIRASELKHAAGQLLESARRYAQILKDMEERLEADQVGPIHVMLSTWIRNAEQARTRADDEEGDFPLIIVSLEAGLSAFHDVINYLCKVVTGVDLDSESNGSVHASL